MISRATSQLPAGDTVGSTIGSSGSKIISPYSLPLPFLNAVHRVLDLDAQARHWRHLGSQGRCCALTISSHPDHSGYTRQTSSAGSYSSWPEGFSVIYMGGSDVLGNEPTLQKQPSADPGV